MPIRNPATSGHCPLATFTNCRNSLSEPPRLGIGSGRMPSGRTNLAGGLSTTSQPVVVISTARHASEIEVDVLAELGDAHEHLVLLSLEVGECLELRERVTDRLRAGDDRLLRPKQRVHESGERGRAFLRRSVCFFRLARFEEELEHELSKLAALDAVILSVSLDLDRGVGLAVARVEQLGPLQDEVRKEPRRLAVERRGVLLGRAA
jgi:hypothetical protein